MPIYFFHLHENSEVLDDEEGSAFQDDASACGAAIRAGRGLLAAAVLEGRLPLADPVVVTDGAGRTICSLTLGAAVGQPIP